jgi:FixJ family two-component response regulator
VLQLIAEGRTVPEIATTLGISPKTVETHRYRLPLASSGGRARPTPRRARFAERLSA